MDSRSPKRSPVPGKRVQLPPTQDNMQATPPKRRSTISEQTLERDFNLLTISEVKKLAFSIQDYPQKFFGKVLCLVPPKQNKSKDVHHHRRAVIIADKTDFIKGYIRSNDDNVIKTGLCYYFSNFKLFSECELLLHENSIIFE